jgi:hypothetical protein
MQRTLIIWVVWVFSFSSSAAAEECVIKQICDVCPYMATDDHVAKAQAFTRLCTEWAKREGHQFVRYDHLGGAPACVVVKSFEGISCEQLSEPPLQ